LSGEALKDTKPGRGLLLQWTGLLAGPLAWVLQLQVAYVLVPWACAHDRQSISLHVVTIVSLLLTAVGALISLREWRRKGREWPGPGGGKIPRSRFMAVLGLFMSAFFFLVILVQGLASFILHPCQP
jgi:hypothetical protein